MKTLIITLLCVGCLHIYAQEDPTKAGIFNLGINIDEELVKSPDFEGGILDILSSEESFPEELIDSIKVLTTNMLSDYLEMPTELAYRKKPIGLVGGYVPGRIEGLPFQRLKQAIKSHAYRQYVSIEASIVQNQSTSVGKTTKIQPAIFLFIKVYDPERNLVDKQKVKLKNFGKLKIKEASAGGRKSTQVLSPYMIYNMYKQALRATLIHS